MFGRGYIQKKLQQRKQAAEERKKQVAEKREIFAAKFKDTYEAAVQKELERRAEIAGRQAALQSVAKRYGNFDERHPAVGKVKKWIFGGASQPANFPMQPGAPARPMMPRKPQHNLGYCQLCHKIHLPNQVRLLG